MQNATKIKHLSMLADETQTRDVIKHTLPVFVVTIAHGCNLSVSETEREREMGCGYSVNSLRTK